MLLSATGLGMVMGTLLGAAQATALRGAVSHPWRWVGANAAAWPLAMALVFLGATTPVQYAALDPRGLVVVPGHAERKSWWTNLRRPGTAVDVLWRGAWHPGLAEVLVRIRDAARSGNP